MLRYHIIKGNLLVISYFILLVSMVTGFWPKHNKCLKMGSNCQIFASLKIRITIFSYLKRIMIVKKSSKKLGAISMHQMTSKY